MCRNRMLDEETKKKATANDGIPKPRWTRNRTSVRSSTVSGAAKRSREALLTDYKVLVVAVDEKYIAGPLQRQLAGENNEISLDDVDEI